MVELVFILGCVLADMAIVYNWVAPSFGIIAYRCVFRVFYGALVAAYVLPADNLLWQLVCVALFVLGSIPGYKNPLMRALHSVNHWPAEFWQVGRLYKDVPLALTLRGAAWVLPIAVVFNQTALALVLPVAMGAAFVASPNLARCVAGIPKDGRVYATAFFRGFIFSSLTVVLNYVI